MTDPVVADPVVADPVVADPVVADPVTSSPIVDTPVQTLSTSTPLTDLPADTVIPSGTETGPTVSNALSTPGTTGVAPTSTTPGGPQFMGGDTALPGGGLDPMAGRNPATPSINPALAGQDPAVAGAPGASVSATAADRQIEIQAKAADTANAIASGKTVDQVATETGRTRQQVISDLQAPGSGITVSETPTSPRDTTTTIQTPDGRQITENQNGMTGASTVRVEPTGAGRDTPSGITGPAGATPSQAPIVTATNDGQGGTTTTTVTPSNGEINTRSVDSRTNTVTEVKTEANGRKTTVTTQLPTQPTTTVTVQPGDNLSTIAGNNGVGLGDVQKNNPGLFEAPRDPNLIQPGETVAVTPQPQVTTKIEHNGHIVTTTPQGNTVIENPSLGTRVEVETDSPEAALADALVEANPNSADPAIAARDRALVDKVGGMLAAEGVEGLQAAAKRASGDLAKAIERFGVPTAGQPNQPGIVATPSFSPTGEILDPRGAPPPGLAPSGGRWVPMTVGGQTVWTDPVIAQAQAAEAAASAQVTEAMAESLRAGAQADVAALDPATSAAAAAADAVIADALEPHGLNYNPEAPGMTLEKAKENLAEANRMADTATASSDAFDRAQGNLAKAISENNAFRDPVLTNAPAAVPGAFTPDFLAQADAGAALANIDAQFGSVGRDLAVGLSQGANATLAQADLLDLKASDPALYGQIETNVAQAATALEFTSQLSNYLDARAADLNFDAGQLKLANDLVIAHDNRLGLGLGESGRTVGGDSTGAFEGRSFAINADGQLEVVDRFAGGHESRTTLTGWEAQGRDPFGNAGLDRAWQGQLASNPGLAGGPAGTGFEMARRNAANAINAAFRERMAPQIDAARANLPRLQGAFAAAGGTSVMPNGPSEQIDIGGQQVAVTPEVAARIRAGDTQLAQRALELHQADTLDTFGRVLDGIINANEAAIANPLSGLELSIPGNEGFAATINPALASDYQADFDALMAGSPGTYTGQFVPQQGGALADTVDQAFGFDGSPQSAEARAAVLEQIGLVGGANPEVMRVPMLRALPGQAVAQPMEVLAVKGANGVIQYVDANGDAYDNLAEFSKTNQLFLGEGMRPGEGMIIAPQGLNLATAMRPDGTIALEAVTDGKAPALTQGERTAIAGMTLIASVAAFTPLAPIAIPVMLIGGTVLGAESLSNQITHMQTGGQAFDGESWMNYAGIAATVMPVGAAGFRGAGLMANGMRGSEAFAGAVGAYAPNSIFGKSILSFMHGDSALAKAAFWTDMGGMAVGTGLTGVQANDLLNNWSDMSGLQRTEALANIASGGVGVAGGGLALKHGRPGTTTRISNRAGALADQTGVNTLRLPDAANGNQVRIQLRGPDGPTVTETGPGIAPGSVRPRAATMKDLKAAESEVKWGRGVPGQGARPETPTTGDSPTALNANGPRARASGRLGTSSGMRTPAAQGSEATNARRTNSETQAANQRAAIRADAENLAAETGQNTIVVNDGNGQRQVRLRGENGPMVIERGVDGNARRVTARPATAEDISAARDAATQQGLLGVRGDAAGNPVRTDASPAAAARADAATRETGNRNNARTSNERETSRNADNASRSGRSRSEGPRNIRDMSPAEIGRMSADDLSALSPEQIAQLSPEQLAAISPDVLAKLSPDFFSHLSAEQLNGLKPEQVDALTTKQLNAIDKEIRGDLTDRLQARIREAEAEAERTGEKDSQSQAQGSRSSDKSGNDQDNANAASEPAGGNRLRDRAANAGRKAADFLRENAAAATTAVAAGAAGAMAGGAVQPSHIAAGGIIGGVGKGLGKMLPGARASRANLENTLNALPTQGSVHMDGNPLQRMSSHEFLLSGHKASGLFKNADGAFNPRKTAVLDFSRPDAHTVARAQEVADIGGTYVVTQDPEAAGQWKVLTPQGGDVVKMSGEVQIGADGQARVVDANGATLRPEMALGHFLGSGQGKVAFAFGDKVAVVERGLGGKFEDLAQQRQVLDQLKQLGVRNVAEPIGQTTIFGRQAAIMDRAANADRSMEAYLGDKITNAEVRDTTLLSQKSVESLNQIRDDLIGNRLAVADLQFLVAPDGTFQIADARSVVRDSGMESFNHRKNIQMIDGWIEAAEHKLANTPLAERTGAQPIKMPGEVASGPLPYGPASPESLGEAGRTLQPGEKAEGGRDFVDPSTDNKPIAGDANTSGWGMAGALAGMAINPGSVATIVAGGVLGAGIGAAAKLAGFGRTLPNGPASEGNVFEGNFTATGPKLTAESPTSAPASMLARLGDLRNIPPEQIGRMSFEEASEMKAPQFFELTDAQKNAFPPDVYGRLQEKFSAQMDEANREGLGDILEGITGQAPLGPTPAKGLFARITNARDIPVSQLRNLTGEQLNSFSREQLHSLTRAQWRAIKPEAIAQLDPATAGFLTDIHFQKMTVPQLRALTPEQINALPSEGGPRLVGSEKLRMQSNYVVRSLTVDQLNAMHSVDLEFLNKPALTINQVRGLSPESLSRMTGFSSEVANGFTDAQLHSLSAEQIQAINPTGFMNLAPRLSPGQIAAMPTDASIHPASFAKMSSAQLRSLSLDTIAGLSDSDFAAFGQREWNSLTSTQRAAITPEQLSSVSPEIRQRLPEGTGLGLRLADSGLVSQDGSPLPSSAIPADAPVGTRGVYDGPVPTYQGMPTIRLVDQLGPVDAVIQPGEVPQSADDIYVRTDADISPEGLSVTDPKLAGKTHVAIPGWGGEAIVIAMPESGAVPFTRAGGADFRMQATGEPPARNVPDPWDNYKGSWKPAETPDYVSNMHAALESAPADRAAAQTRLNDLQTQIAEAKEARDLARGTPHAEAFGQQVVRLQTEARATADLIKSLDKMIANPSTQLRQSWDTAFEMRVRESLGWGTYGLQGDTRFLAGVEIPQDPRAAHWNPDGFVQLPGGTHKQSFGVEVKNFEVNGSEATSGIEKIKAKVERDFIKKRLDNFSENAPVAVTNNFTRKNIVKEVLVMPADVAPLDSQKVALSQHIADRLTVSDRLGRPYQITEVDQVLYLTDNGDSVTFQSVGKNAAGEHVVESLTLTDPAASAQMSQPSSRAGDPSGPLQGSEAAKQDPATGSDPVPPAGAPGGKGPDGPPPPTGPRGPAPAAGDPDEGSGGSGGDPIRVNLNHPNRPAQGAGLDAPTVPIPVQGGSLDAPTVPIPVQGGGLDAPTVPIRTQAGGLDAPTVPIPVQGGGLDAPTVPIRTQTGGLDSPTVPIPVQGGGLDAPTVPIRTQGGGLDAPTIPIPVQGGDPGAQTGSVPPPSGDPNAPTGPGLLGGIKGKALARFGAASIFPAAMYGAAMQFIPTHGNLPVLFATAAGAVGSGWIAGRAITAKVQGAIDSARGGDGAVNAAKAPQWTNFVTTAVQAAAAPLAAVAALGGSVGLSIAGRFIVPAANVIGGGINGLRFGDFLVGDASTGAPPKGTARKPGINWVHSRFSALGGEVSQAAANVALILGNMGGIAPNGVVQTALAVLGGNAIESGVRAFRMHHAEQMPDGAAKNAKMNNLNWWALGNGLVGASAAVAIFLENLNAEAAVQPPPPPTKATPRLTPLEPTPNEPYYQRRVNPLEGANVRETPGLDGRKVGALSGGSFANPTGPAVRDATGREWIPVNGFDASGNPISGFVAESLLQIRAPIEDVPPGGRGDPLRGVSDTEGRLNPNLEAQGYRSVIVRKGDSVGSIARRNGVSVSDTVGLNLPHLGDNATRVYAGDRVYLPN